MANIQRRFVVMGSAGVGKTCIILRMLYNTFCFNYIETNEELHSYNHIFRDGTRLSLEVLDTSGAKNFPAMQKLAISAANVFVLVYEVDNEESWNDVVRLRNEILRERGLDIPIVIVCNKSDLNTLQTTHSIICECTAMIDFECPHVVCSALNNTNIDILFKEMLFASGVRIMPRQPVFTRIRNRLTRMITSVRGAFQN